MKSVLDWSGDWPSVTFQSGFRNWSVRRLLLGLQVAAVVAVLFLAAAAQAGGYTLVAYLQLGVIFAAVMTRLEWVNTSRHVRQERHH